MKHNRRHWLGAMGSGVIAGAIPQNADAQTSSSMSKPLDLSQFQPKSALHAKETKVPKPRYPVIDVHTHLSFSRKREVRVHVDHRIPWLRHLGLFRVERTLWLKLREVERFTHRG